MVKKVQEKQLDKADNVKDEEAQVDTVLSLLDHDKTVMSDVQKEVLQEEIDELAPIKENNINVAGVYVFDLGEQLEVKVYLRNGYSTKVKFDKIPFSIINSKGETLAYQVFDLKPLGEIPAKGARPWKLIFDKKNVFADNISMDDWKIIFDANLDVKQNFKIRYENLPEGLEIEDKLVYDNFLESLPKLNLGQFGVSPFSIGMEKDGNILVTLVMRNAATKAIQLQKVPITLKDDKGNVVKSNLFELDDLSIEPFRAKICNFVFPTGLKLEENISLSNWSVLFELDKKN